MLYYDDQHNHYPKHEVTILIYPWQNFSLTIPRLSVNSLTWFRSIP